MPTRIAFRCDGGEAGGAGHVSRCLPIARAFDGLGFASVFVGRYDGLAEWLLRDVDREPLGGEAPAGVDPERFAAAVVDSYNIAQEAICALAGAIPLATLAEARRCPDAGVLVDYHFDRAGEEPGKGVLPGPAFAPVDPAFASARRDRAGAVGTLLVSLGGGSASWGLGEAAVRAAHAAFGDVTVLSPRPLEGTVQLLGRGSLAGALPRVDVAVAAAGVTAYELACAGVPTVLVQVADNQRRVIEGAKQTGVALVAEASEPGIEEALNKLGSAQVREHLQRAGPGLVDGAGAVRVARALAERWAVEPSSKLARS